MSDSRFATRDGLALLALLGILSAMTIVIWIPLHLLSPIDASVSDIYLLSCVLLLAAHLVRQRHRTRRRARQSPKESTSHE